MEITFPISNGMNTTRVQQTTSAFKILSDPTRFKILMLLFDKRAVCVQEIADAVGISHSAASHQLAGLEAKGIVSCSRNGKMMCYDVNETPATRKLAMAMKLFI